MGLVDKVQGKGGSKERKDESLVGGQTLSPSETFYFLFFTDCSSKIALLWKMRASENCKEMKNVNILDILSLSSGYFSFFFFKIEL